MESTLLRHLALRSRRLTRASSRLFISSFASRRRRSTRGPRCRPLSSVYGVDPFPTGGGIQLLLLCPEGRVSLKTRPCLSKNFDGLCQRVRSSLASSSARTRSRAASHSSSGTQTSMTFPTESILARNSASLRSFFLFRSAGVDHLRNAPTTQSTPSAASFCRSNPVTGLVNALRGRVEGSTHSATAAAS